MNGKTSGAEPFDPVAYLNNEGWQKVELGLERTTELLARLGDPQKDCTYVHVAGTNGKGSVCAYIERALREAGYAPGLFTSPAIYTFEERICVDGRPITADELYAATVSVRGTVEAMVAEGWEHPTGFELMFAVAAVHFKTMGCRIAVLEVGLGGRLDATNVIEDPAVCVITPIGLDHTAVLGDTIGAIAAEKAAIIKPGAIVVAGRYDADAMDVIEAAAKDADDELVLVEPNKLEASSLDLEAGVRRFTYEGRPYETLLLGSYQPENAALAIEACRALNRSGWPLTEEQIATGVKLATWPGRFEIVAKAPLVIVDGAHNPQGAESLRRSLQDFLDELAQTGRRPRVIMVLGVLADKDASGILSPLVELADFVATFPPPIYRALPGEELAKLVASMGEKRQKKNPDSLFGFEVVACASAAQALAEALRTANGDAIIVCAGSLYSLGAIRDALAEWRDVETSRSSSEF